MHRHFHADQVMVPLSGYMLVSGADRKPSPLHVGQVLVVPRYNWHEARNVSDADCVVLHIFSGVGDISEIGFEEWSPRFEAGGDRHSAPGR